MVRVFLVDDQLMFTEALASRLAEDDGADSGPQAGLWVAGRCATDDPRLLDLLARHRPDVVTVEIESIGADLGEWFARLRTAWPELRIVVLSGAHDPARAVSAARAGAAAWVPKEADAAELARVVRGVGQGKSWFPPDLLGEVLRELRADVRRAADGGGPLDVLSPRERDVLLSMVEGRHGRQIAEALLISQDTVRTHTRSILAKLGVHSRLEAVRVARAAGLRPPAHPAPPYLAAAADR